jgi:hypothetical protein
MAIVAYAYLRISETAPTHRSVAAGNVREAFGELRPETPKTDASDDEAKAKEKADDEAKAKADDEAKAKARAALALNTYLDTFPIPDKADLTVDVKALSRAKVIARAPYTAKYKGELSFDIGMYNVYNVTAISTLKSSPGTGTQPSTRESCRLASVCLMLLLFQR